MEIRILKDFLEDKRVSMENYAEQLNLFIGNQIEFNVKSFTPRISDFIGSLPLSDANIMRIARFFLYPRQINKFHADIFHIVDHGYSHLLKGLPSQKTVVTVHDLIPLLAYKGLVPGMQYRHRPYFVEYSLSFLKKAALVVAVSESTRGDVIKHLGCRPDKVCVVYNGLDQAMYFEGHSERKLVLRNSFELPQKKTLIMISGNEFYKNHQTVLEVLKILKGKGFDFALLKLGRDTAEWLECIRTAGFEDLYFSFHSLDRAKVADLYRCADCLFFPSFYEGFGWPPLEAMACGVPVVASNAASLPEVIGDAGLMSDPLDVKNLSFQIESVLTNHEFRNSLIKRGLERAGLFSLEKTLGKMKQIYVEVNEKAKQDIKITGKK